MSVYCVENLVLSGSHEFQNLYRQMLAPYSSRLHKWIPPPETVPNNTRSVCLWFGNGGLLMDRRNVHTRSSGLSMYHTHVAQITNCIDGKIPHRRNTSCTKRIRHQGHRTQIIYESNIRVCKTKRVLGLVEP